jgi:PadR family transcriptional regulator, regulatory protein AphA
VSKRTPFRGALLGLIAHRPMSGYDLAKVFDSTLANVWSAKHSQIYPELMTMLDDGVVEVRDAGSRGRKEYAITDRGRQELVAWLASALPTSRLVRNEALLRTFFLGVLPFEEARGLLRTERERHAERLAAYLAEQEGPVSRSGVWTGHIPLEAGVRYERMMVEWAEWALEELERLHRERDGSRFAGAGTSDSARRPSC